MEIVNSVPGVESIKLTTIIEEQKLNKTDEGQNVQLVNNVFVLL